MINILFMSMRRTLELTPTWDSVNVSQSPNKIHCVYLNTSIKQLRLTLSTLHAKMCCWKHTTSTVRAKHDSWDHEELRHVGLTPIALGEPMSREWDSQNDFAVVKMILPWLKFILPWVKMILSWLEWSWFYREWNWFCRIVKLIVPCVKLILPWRNWFSRG